MLNLCTYFISSSCGIEIQDSDGEDQIVVTGGYGAWNIAAVYNLKGWIKDLQPLKESAVRHGCTSFMSNGKRVGKHCKSLEIFFCIFS